MGLGDDLTEETSGMPAYACRNRSARESGPRGGWCTRAPELGGGEGAAVVTGVVTGGTVRVTSEAGWLAAVAAGSADLPAGAGMATVTRAGEAAGGVCSSPTTSAIGTAECAAPDRSMRRGSATGISSEIGGGVVGRSRRASAAAFCFLARSAFIVAASEALFREGGGTVGGGTVEVFEPAGGAVEGATGSRDRAAL